MSTGFAVGGIASGEAFIGRKDAIEDLSAIFSTPGSVHLIGAPRMGKSSLVEKTFEQNEGAEGVIPVRLDMSHSQNAFQFWIEFLEMVIDETDYDDLSCKLDQIVCLGSDDPWYPRIKRLIKQTFSRLKSDNVRVVIAIDEFDAVSRLFNGEPAYFQLLRTLFSSSKYAINGVIVSRRSLEALEARTIDISTFHGIFRTIRLLGFNESDMGEFYSKIESNGVLVPQASRDQLSYFTGNIPYLCCIFADRLLFSHKTENLLEASEDTIVKIYRDQLPTIESYYRDLVERLDEDSHLEPLVYLAFGDMRTLAYHRTRQSMIAMGYLNEELIDGVPSYFAYSRDFMSYLRNRSLDLPIWELLSSSERKIKRLFGHVYPEFNQVTHADVHGPNAKEEIGKLCKTHPELNFQWKTETERFLNSACSYRENPSVLDVLPVTFVISRITFQWEKKFATYFGNDGSWKLRLLEIKEIRDPLAHAQEEYIDEKRMARCKHYLEEFLKLDLGIDDEGPSVER